jgi:hypothetical protein
MIGSTLGGVDSSAQADQVRRDLEALLADAREGRDGRTTGGHVRRVLRALRASTPGDDLHLSALAEALVAVRLLRAGCALEFEAPTPAGRHADLRAERGGVAFFVHVKRLLVGPGADHAPLPPAIAALAEIPRPLTIGIRWNRTPGADHERRVAESVREFVLQASAGDELDVVAPDGAWLGHCRVLAPHAGATVEVRVEDGAEAAAVPRAQRLLRRAFSQFMPGAVNTICVVGDGPASARALDTALRGTVIERWDRFPPRGRRTAHGHADDGFWAGGRYEGCDLVAWLPMDDGMAARLWTRRHGARTDAVEHILREALGVPSNDGARVVPDQPTPGDAAGPGERTDP